MFSSSQFEPNSGFSGGGFMYSQPSQAYDSSPSTAKNREFQGLVPMTVKQIREASKSGGDKSGLIINEIEVTNVTLVGLVSDKNDTNFTEVSFVLDDGTGRIECKRWHLKSFQGKKQLLVFSVRPVTDFNEVTFHSIECIRFHSRNSKSRQVGGITQSPMENSSVNNSMIQGGLNVTQVATSNHASAQNDSSGRKNLDDLILDYLKQPSCSDIQQGIHLDDISQQLKIPKNKLEDVIHSLESDGLIYIRPSMSFTSSMSSFDT